MMSTHQRYNPRVPYVILSVGSGAGSGDWLQVGSGQGPCNHRLGELMGTHSVRELVQHRSQQPVGSNQVHHPEGLSNFI